LHQAGFTDRQLAPWEERVLLEHRLGITNIVARATASAAELAPDELRAGRRSLVRKVRRYEPRWIAVLGIAAYRAAFDRRHALIGRQAETIGSTGVWVLPNPSGLNANHQLPDLMRLFRELKAAMDRRVSPRR
jgi:double-stranded uracil-DNA glycosylase